VCVFSIPFFWNKKKVGSPTLFNRARVVKNNDARRKRVIMGEGGDAKSSSEPVPDDHMKSTAIGPPPNALLMTIPFLQLENGARLERVQVCYSTYGRLNDKGDNCVLVGHSLTSNSNVDEWWSEFLGSGGEDDAETKCSLNLEKDFIVCCNYLGSPYGTASPVSENPETPGKIYGSRFPAPVTIRDNVNLQKMVLDQLKVTKLSMCIGGSMGAMLALEFAASFPEFVEKLVLIAGCGKHTDWAIGIGEAQRHAIVSDVNFEGGDYDVVSGGPKDGLATSRMMAMLSYRAPVSMDEKFSRMNVEGREHAVRGGGGGGGGGGSENENEKMNDKQEGDDKATTQDGEQTQQKRKSFDHNNVPYWQVESYLQYQGQKFIQRFDANCYLQLTYTLDSHDVSRGRENGDYERVLSKLTHDTLVVGILSDVLYPFALQRELADCMPNAQLYTIDSPHGHDSFLIEINSLNEVIRRWRNGENVEVRDPCESVALLEGQQDKERRQSSSSPSTTGMEDNETLKRTVRALREELARVHGNLRAQTARADLYLRKLQALNEDDSDEKNSNISQQPKYAHKNNIGAPHGVIVLNEPGYLNEGFSPLSSSLSARGPVFGKICANNGTGGNVSASSNGTSHAGV